jgi:MFS family permease
MLSVLCNRNYALLWIAGLISNLGDWVLIGALPFYVYARTGSPLATGLTFIASAVPWVVLSSVAGVFVDRWDRKRTMIIADLTRAGLILLLLLVVYVHSLFWLVYVVSFVEACITQFFNPASIALIPQIVGQEHLQQANSLNSLSSSTSRLLGPLLGGVLLGMLGLSSTVIADSISYFCSAAMIALILVPSDLSREKPVVQSRAATRWISYWRDWLAGLSSVKQERTITVLFLVVALAALADGIINALFVVHPAAILHLGPSQYGEMLTALGIGSIIGSLLSGRFARIMSSARFVMLGLLGKGFIYLLAFNTRSFPVILILFILSGIPTVGWQVGTQTLLQTNVQDRLRGRVLGAYVATLSLLLLVGTGIGSVLGAPLGIVLVLDIGCSLFIVAGTVALLISRASIATKQPPSRRYTS